jgi:hypothetical protein
MNLSTDSLASSGVLQVGSCRDLGAVPIQPGFGFQLIEARYGTSLLEMRTRTKLYWSFDCGPMSGAANHRIVEYRDSHLVFPTSGW